MKPARERTRTRRATPIVAPPVEADPELVEISMLVNGEPRTGIVEPRTSLAAWLRERLLLTGTKLGCNEGTCGSCTVLLDGRPVYSCMLLALDAAGHHVVTVEGVGTPHAPHPLQTAFAETYAAQCGYCTPGLIVTAKALLDLNPAPTEAQVRAAIAGNLCKCAAYPEIVTAILQAAERLRRTVHGYYPDES